MHPTTTRFRTFVICLSVALSSTSTIASVTASSEIVLDWTTFAASLDPGVSLAWTEQGSVSIARVRYEGQDMDVQDVPSNDWNDTYAVASYSMTEGSATATALANTDAIHISVAAFSDEGGKFESHCHGWGDNHWGRFVVTGSGYVTFSVDYRMSVTLYETRARPLDLATAFAETDIWLNYAENPLEPQEGQPNPWWHHRSRWYPDWAEPLNDTWLEDGTLTATLWFDDGVEGFVRVGAATQVAAESVPEAATLGLLALGGLVMFHRRPVDSE